MLLRPCTSATSPTVPEPPKGSRTVHDIGSPALQVQVDRQPVVFDSAGDNIVPELRVWPRECNRLLRLITMCFCSTILSHGLPQSGQHPRSLVPARMQGRTRLGGKVAKWASLYGCVAIVQTERLLRIPFSAFKLSPLWLLIFDPSELDPVPSCLRGPRCVFGRKAISRSSSNRLPLYPTLTGSLIASAS